MMKTLEPRRAEVYIRSRRIGWEGVLYDGLTYAKVDSLGTVVPWWRLTQRGIERKMERERRRHDRKFNVENAPNPALPDIDPFFLEPVPDSDFIGDGPKDKS